jgi:hypothetical protein
VQDRVEVRGHQHRPSLERLQIAVIAHDRRMTDLEVDVARAACDRSGEEGDEVDILQLR